MRFNEYDTQLQFPSIHNTLVRDVTAFKIHKNAFLDKWGYRTGEEKESKT